MTRNKILSAAIAAALSMGSGLAYAAAGSFVGPIGGVPTDAAHTKVAFELFDPNETDEIIIPGLPTGAATSPHGNYIFTYALAETANITQDFDVTFTLAKANFTTSEPVLTSDITDLALVQHVEAAKTNTVTFTVKAGTTNIPLNTGILSLASFDIKVVENVFATPGQKATITISFTEDVGDTQTKTLLETAPCTAVTFAVTDKSEIDVAESGFKFIPGFTPAAPVIERASIGTVLVAATTPPPFIRDMSGTCAIGGAGILNITNGPFSSLDAEAKVFIDGGIVCDFDTDGGIEAVLSGSDATFTIPNMTSLAATAKNICVTVPATNAIAIDETDDAPQASLTISYTSPAISITSSTATLWHLQNNGASCFVSNVTDDRRTDISYVRITNTGSTAATVMGTLVGMDGKSVFEGVDLAAEEGLTDGLASNATLVLNSEELVAIANAYPPADGANPVWKRGVLTVTSTANKGKLEVYLLLQAGMDAPQMNMSYGGSLDGCNN
jgi:hypothetical protein